MDKNFETLLLEFKRISKKRYIRSVSKGIGNIGLTFESELFKAPDSKYLPDYKGIELKCKSRFSHYPIFLFTVAFDGPNYNEISYIVEKYGYYDKDYKDKKVLYTELNCKYLNEVDNKYNFKLEISYNENKLYLCVYNKNKTLIEKSSYVNIDTIFEHLITKLSKLAIIHASKKKDDFFEYFRYYCIEFYTLKNKKIFLDLLEEGIITISLISRISKSGIDSGRYRNKNLIFKINENYIPLLFTKIYEYNTDKFNIHEC